MHEEPTPVDVREGVRSGILASIRQDVEKRGGHTARLLLAAGAIGALGAIGLTRMLADHPFDHHPSWHLVVFTAVWASVLVVSLALVFLQVRSPSLPLSYAASVGILGLGIAGICGSFCPDPHFLTWWSGTSMGLSLSRLGGLALCALCFGLVATSFVGIVSGLVVPVPRARPFVRVLLPAAMLTLLLMPGVALQSVDTSGRVLVGWLLGTAIGACVGVAGGVGLRSLVASH
jgi:hypothetical protein